MVSDAAIPEWIRGLRQGLTAYLENVRHPGAYGRFRYAVEGCVLPHEPISSCYAFGILERTNAYQDLGTQEQEEWTAYLQSLQDEYTGEFWSEDIGRLCKPQQHGQTPRIS